MRIRIVCLLFVIGTLSTGCQSSPSSSTHPSEQVRVAGDLHIHTSCSDGANSYEEIVQRAIRVGYDFMAITDHVPGSDETCRQSVLEACQQETRLVCLPGAEISGRHHVLALGIREVIDASLPLQQQVAEIHQHGGLAIAAHPLIGWGELERYTADELRFSGFDAMECEDLNDWWWDILRNDLGLDYPPLPCVYNSDAHHIQSIERREGKYNLCYVPITTLDDLKKALQTGQCRQYWQEQTEEEGNLYEMYDDVFGSNRDDLWDRRDHRFDWLWW